MPCLGEATYRHKQQHSSNGLGISSEHPKPTTSKTAPSSKLDSTPTYECFTQTTVRVKHHKTVGITNQNPGKQSIHGKKSKQNTSQKLLQRAPQWFAPFWWSPCSRNTVESSDRIESQRTTPDALGIQMDSFSKGGFGWFHGWGIEGS